MTFTFNTQEIHHLKIDYEKLILSGKQVNKVASINRPLDNSIIFINSLDKKYSHLLGSIKNCLLIAKSLEVLPHAVEDNNDVIIVNNPRLAYAIILSYILSKNPLNKSYRQYDNCIFIGENVEICESVKLEPNITIGHNVRIGSNSIIYSGVRIGDSVTIGENTTIRSNSVIGSAGFGVEKDEYGKAIRIPHLGSVIIGDNVDIGALNTVVAGTIEPTVIEDNVITDDHVHIAHNCHIGSGTLITACSEISGSVKIGKNVWVGPNSSIINKVSIKDQAVIGIGAVVTKDVEAGLTVAGSPAKDIEYLKREKKQLELLLKNR